MTRDPFDIPEIARLRDWANACVERDALHRKQSITIKAPVVTTYKVKSLNSSKVYSLTERNNHWTCNCPAMQFYSNSCLLYTSPSPRDGLLSRMPSSA